LQLLGACGALGAERVRGVARDLVGARDLGESSLFSWWPPISSTTPSGCRGSRRRRVAVRRERLVRRVDLGERAQRFDLPEPRARLAGELEAACARSSASRPRPRRDSACAPIAEQARDFGMRAQVAHRARACSRSLERLAVAPEGEVRVAEVVARDA
jgi:hypothetical protein